jgi:hypothetical protein
MNLPVPSNNLQIVTNTKQKNKLLAKDYYETTLEEYLPVVIQNNPIARKNWAVSDLDYYIKTAVGKQLIENEFHTGLVFDDNSKKQIVKRKYTKKTLISNLAKELKLPELAISYIYEDLSESDLLRTKKNDAKEFVNINVENALNEVDLSIMDSNDPKEKAALYKSKIELLKLYLESNDAIQKGQGTTINNVTGAQTNLSNAQIQNNQVNNKIEDQKALNDVVSQIIAAKKQTNAQEFIEGEIV